MIWLISILPQIIAGLIVAAGAGVVALAFHTWRRRRRIAQLRQVESECWEILRLQEEMQKFLRINMEEVTKFGQALLAFKKQPTPDKFTEVETTFQSTGEFISEQMKILEDSRKPVANRREQARDELSKLQSGLSD